MHTFYILVADFSAATLIIADDSKVQRSSLTGADTVDIGRGTDGTVFSQDANGIDADVRSIIY